MTALPQGKSKCPSIEMLSIFADEQTDPDILEHLDECHSCRQIADDFIQLDNLVGEVSHPSPDLAEKIISACRQDQAHRTIFLASLVHSPTGTSRTWSHLIRVAAAVVIIAGVLTVWFGRPQTNGQNAIAMSAPKQIQAAADIAKDTIQSDFPQSTQPMIASAADVPQVQETVSDLAEQEAFSLNDLQAIKGRIPSQSLRTVSFNGNRQSRTSAKTAPLPISPLTSHTWLVDDLDKATDQLNRLCSTASCKIVWNPVEDKNVRTARILAQDSTIKALADELYDSRWHLLSPQQPQPHSNMIRLTGNEVIYSVKLVR